MAAVLSRAAGFCFSRRGLTLVVALIFSTVCLTYLNRLKPDVTELPVPKFLDWTASPVYNFHEACGSAPKAASLDIWDKAKNHSMSLMEDKFTIAIQTFRRPDPLAATIKLLTETEIPSLHEIVVIWNDLSTKTPENYVSEIGVPVRYRMSKANSLNEKFRPDSDYKTKAILLSDDDVHYQPADLEYVFQTWRRYGQNRITGAFARCVKKGDWGALKYDFCANRDPYSLVLTGLAFTHIAFLDYYSSVDKKMVKLREYVDEKFNCEDIALNFVTSMLTCAGPLQVAGFDKAVNTAPPKGISTKPGHLGARHQCLDDFKKIFGGNPLVPSQEYMQRGLRIG